MPSNNVAYCLLIRDSLQNNGEPQINSICSIQEMPNELQEKWSEAIVEELLFNNAEQNDSFLSLVLNLDGTIEIMNDSGNSDPEIYSAHYHSLAEITRALEAHQQPKDLSTHRPTPVNALNNFNRAQSLNLLSQATMTNTIVGFTQRLAHSLTVASDSQLRYEYSVSPLSSMTNGSGN